jgi:hypothetical protein
MLSLENIGDALTTKLTDIFGIDDWDTIQFSMLPGEPNKGYFQVVEVNPGRSVHESTWLVGIGIAKTNLGDLRAEVSNIVNLTVTNFAQIDSCIEGLGSAKLSDQIQIEIPDTYSQQSSVSITSGYKTAVSFGLRITTAI